jgi:hypothetical protein
VAAIIVTGLAVISIFFYVRASFGTSALALVVFPAHYPPETLPAVCIHLIQFRLAYQGRRMLIGVRLDCVVPQLNFRSSRRLPLEYHVTRVAAAAMRDAPPWVPKSGQRLLGSSASLIDPIDLIHV